MYKCTVYLLEELECALSNQGFEEPCGVAYGVLLWVMISCFSYAVHWIEKWLRTFLSSCVPKIIARCHCRNVCVRPIYLLTNLLTELSPSWETANCAATQELPNILRNPKVHHCVHKSPPLVPILSQIDPVHTIPFYLSKNYFNIVHPLTSSSS
jgi:hypothetical protein